MIIQKILEAIYNKEIEFGQKNNLKYRFENKDLVLFDDKLEIVFWTIKNQKIEWCVEIFNGEERIVNTFSLPMERLDFVKDVVGDGNFRFFKN